jgi:monolysocardiolipin acyltransferase
MPEGRSFPWKYLPRRSVDLSVTFGEPVPPADIRRALASTTSAPMDLAQPSFEIRTPHSDASKDDRPNIAVRVDELALGDPAEEEVSRKTMDEGWLGIAMDAKEKQTEEGRRAQETARIRSELTAVLQREVEKLGRKVIAIVSR